MINEEEMHDWMGIGEAARSLGVSNNYAHRLFDADKLQGVVTPIGRLVSRQSLEDLRATRAEKLAKRMSPTSAQENK